MNKIKQFLCLHKETQTTEEWFVPIDKTLRNGYYCQTGECLRCGKKFSRRKPKWEFRFTSLEPFE